MLVIRRVKCGQEKRRSCVNRQYFKQQATVPGNVRFFFLLLLATIHILWESIFYEIHVFQTHYLRFLIPQWIRSAIRKSDYQLCSLLIAMFVEKLFPILKRIALSFVFVFRKFIGYFYAGVVGLYCTDVTLHFHFLRKQEPLQISKQRSSSIGHGLRSSEHVPFTKILSNKLIIFSSSFASNLN
jgi:hypothetical protein